MVKLATGPDFVVRFLDVIFLNFISLFLTAKIRGDANECLATKVHSQTNL